MDEKINDDKKYNDKNFQDWKKRWSERLKVNNSNPHKCSKLMKSVNPIVIPRNHKVEEALNSAEENNLEPINKIIEILKEPYNQQKNILDYQIPSSLNEKYQTFCGT
jgi:Uncharacterized conserved protein